MMERKGIEIMESPRERLEKLNLLIRNISIAINREAESLPHGIKNLLEPDGTISMTGFATDNGGIYSKQQIADDKERNYQNEIGFAVAYNQPAERRKQAVEDWRQSKKKSKANQIEMAIMALFYKMLKDEFIVVRSAEYDDYEGGTDNLLVEKKTGKVLCAIDDVHIEDSNIPGRSSVRGKDEKILKKALRGGVEVKYGLTVQEKKLTRVRLQNLPVFYLGLTSDQFNRLTTKLSPDPAASASDTEKQIFSAMIAELEGQKNALSTLPLKGDIKNNLNKVMPILDRLRQIAGLPPAGLPEALSKAA